MSNKRTKNSLPRIAKSVKILSLLLGLFILSWILIAPLRIPYFQSQKIHSIEEIPHNQVAIVFGALALSNGQPSDILKDRLKSAAELYFEGKVDAILVSGDNRFEDYNEPETMKNYLLSSWGIPSEDVVEDFAGRRTYDTCARASTIWGLTSATLVTQEYHLPRALYTCEKWGIESVGYSATLQTYIYEDNYAAREVLAIYKALLDFWILRPEFVGGEYEDDFIKNE